MSGWPRLKTKNLSEILFKEGEKVWNERQSKSAAKSLTSGGLTWVELTSTMPTFEKQIGVKRTDSGKTLIGKFLLLFKKEFPHNELKIGLNIKEER